MSVMWLTGTWRRVVPCLFLVAFVFGSGAAANAQDKAGAGIGRYELVPCEGQARLLIIDTTTGECWSRGERSGDRWVDLKFPVNETKGTKGASGRFRLRTLCDSGKNGATVIALIVWDTADGRCWQTPYDGVRDARWEALPAVRPK